MAEKRNAYSVLVGTPERRRPLGRSRYSWEDNIGMDLRGKGWELVDWINLAFVRDNWWAFFEHSNKLLVL
jgi:hypothetical protein